MSRYTRCLHDTEPYPCILSTLPKKFKNFCGAAFFITTSITITLLLLLLLSFDDSATLLCCCNSWLLFIQLVFFDGNYTRLCNSFSLLAIIPGCTFFPLTLFVPTFLPLFCCNKLINKCIIHWNIWALLRTCFLKFHCNIYVIDWVETTSSEIIYKVFFLVGLHTFINLVKSIVKYWEILSWCEILGWCPVRPVLPHGDKVPL